MVIGRVEQISGALLALLILLDVFLTVLYARMGSGLISARLARIVWRSFRVVAKISPGNASRILSFCGPTILVVLVLVWSGGLAVANALIIHPVLGSAVQASGGNTPTDFISALYVGGNSISIVGAGDFFPRSSSFRLLYVFDSIAGMSVISLTLTYLMQIYSQLQQRNVFALKIYLATRCTGDAAELIAGIGPGGTWANGASNLWELASGIAITKEAHHFYPVLFYMRFPDPFYSVSFATLVLLDSVTLMRSALSDENTGIKKMGALDQLYEGAMVLLTALEENFLTEGSPHPRAPDAVERRQWKCRFEQANERFREAGISTRPDREDAFTSYLSLRTQWNDAIYRLASSMMYSIEEIDVAVARNRRSA